MNNTSKVRVALSIAALGLIACGTALTPTSSSESDLTSDGGAKAIGTDDWGTDNTGTDDTVYGGFDSGTEKCTRVTAVCLPGWEIYKCPSNVSKAGWEIATRGYGKWSSWSFCDDSACVEEIASARTSCAYSFDGGSWSAFDGGGTAYYVDSGTSNPTVDAGKGKKDASAPKIDSGP